MTDKISGSDARGVVSAKKVADLAGVPQEAVLRTLEPGASVSPATSKRVFAAAKAFGYQVENPVGEHTRTSSGIVALLAADVHTPHRSR